MSSRPLAFALLAGLACAAAPARADLSDDAERLSRAWSDHGARVERLPPLFLDHGRARNLVLVPPREGDPSCITIAVVGVRTADFSLSREDRQAEGGAPAPRHDDAAADGRVRSAGGVAVISACGAERARLDRIRVEMGSARATLEIVAVRSDAPPRALREILPERTAGPLAPRGETGGPLAPRPLAERLARADRRARTDGAAQIDRVTGRANGRGAGRFEVELAPGCHRLEVLADTSKEAPNLVTDVDADVRDASGRMLARDRSDLPDARLDLCVGEITPVSVPFAGAGGEVPVVLVHARWPMPARVPSRWGPRARAGFASALFRRRAPDPPEPAIVEVLGVQGATAIPFEVQPNHCYLAALAMVRGEARTIRLTATAGDRVGRDDAADHPESVSVSFCADRESVARLGVDVRAAAGVWTLSVWPMGVASP
ncbi:MAG: hypothetical protein QM820_23225 [Minicystis sp.]